MLPQLSAMTLPKVFCTEILGGDLKSQNMRFLWLEVFITMSQQYLMT